MPFSSLVFPSHHLALWWSFFLKLETVDTAAILTFSLLFNKDSSFPVSPTIIWIFLKVCLWNTTFRINVQIKIKAWLGRRILAWNLCVCFGGAWAFMIKILETARKHANLALVFINIPVFAFWGVLFLIFEYINLNRCLLHSLFAWTFFPH